MTLPHQYVENGIYAKEYEMRLYVAIDNQFLCIWHCVTFYMVTNTVMECKIRRARVGGKVWYVYNLNLYMEPCLHVVKKWIPKSCSTDKISWNS